MVAQPIVLFLQYIMFQIRQICCTKALLETCKLTLRLRQNGISKYGTWCKTTRATYLQNVLSELVYAKIYRFSQGNGIKISLRGPNRGQTQSHHCRKAQMNCRRCPRPLCPLLLLAVRAQERTACTFHCTCLCRA